MAAGRACVADELNLKGECIAAGEAGSFLYVSVQLASVRILCLF